MTKPAKRPVGRPSKWSDELAARIIAELASGKSMVNICSADGMPGLRTVHEWQETRESFRAECARARESAADIEADEIKALADEQPERDERGRIDPAFIAWKRNQISARQWRASKLAPRRYGDSVNVAHSGSVNVTMNSDDASL